MACNSDDSIGCCTGKKAALLRLFDITKHSISSLQEMREAVRKKIPDLCLRKEHLSDQDIVFYDVHRRTQPSRKHERFAFANPIPYNNNNAMKQEGGWDSSPQVGDTNSAKPESDVKETPFITRLKELEKLKMRTIASDQRRRHSFSYFRKTMPYHVRRTSLESCNEVENGTNHHHRHPQGLHNPSDDKTTFSYDSFARDPQSWPSVSSSSPEAGEEADLSKLIERVLKLRQQQPAPKLTKPRKPRMGCYMPARRRTGIGGTTHRGTTTVKKDADPLELLNSEANRKKTPASAASSEVLPPRKRSPKKPQNEDMIVKQGRKRSKSVKRRTVLNVAAAKA